VAAGVPACRILIEQAGGHGGPPPRIRDFSLVLSADTLACVANINDNQAQTKSEDTNMLGEKIGEEKGRITGRRISRNDDLSARVESSQQGTGQILGTKYTTMSTYWSVMRSSGTLYGEGQGLTMTEDGESMTWLGSGVGILKGNGGVGFRGAIYFNTSSKKLSALNSVAVLFEYDVDAEGNFTSQLFEWK